MNNNNLTEIRKSEEKLQQDCFMWFRNAYCLVHHLPRLVIFHVPNQNQHHLTSIGVLAGVSDLVIMLPSGRSLWVEVKTDAGRQSGPQIDFQARIEALGHTYILVRSLHDFKQKVQQRVNMP